MPRLGHIHELSRCAIKLSMRDTDGIALGTGFLYRALGETWLVTAGHNMTGTHPQTGSPLNEHNRKPSEIAFKVGEVQGDTIQFRSVTVPLVGGESTASALYQLGPDGADVSALKLPSTVDVGDYHHAVNDDLQTVEPFRNEAGTDTFVLGFPEGLSLQGHVPLWKHATVASDPASTIPSFYVDTATRRGMSGSPVFARLVGLINPPGAIETLSEKTIIGEAFQFVGVYTSRELADDTGFKAQIGNVFTVQTIERTIAGVSPVSR